MALAHVSLDDKYALDKRLRVDFQGRNGVVIGNWYLDDKNQQGDKRVEQGPAERWNKSRPLCHRFEVVPELCVFESDPFVKPRLFFPDSAFKDRIELFRKIFKKTFWRFLHPLVAPRIDQVRFTRTVRFFLLVRGAELEHQGGQFFVGGNTGELKRFLPGQFVVQFCFDLLKFLFILLRQLVHGAGLFDDAPVELPDEIVHGFLVHLFVVPCRFQILDGGVPVDECFCDPLFFGHKFEIAFPQVFQEPVTLPVKFGLYGNGGPVFLTAVQQAAVGLASLCRRLRTEEVGEGFFLVGLDQLSDVEMDVDTGFYGFFDHRSVFLWIRRLGKGCSAPIQPSERSALPRVGHGSKPGTKQGSDRFPVVVSALEVFFLLVHVHQMPEKFVLPDKVVFKPFVHQSRIHFLVQFLLKGLQCHPGRDGV